MSSTLVDDPRSRPQTAGASPRADDNVRRFTTAAIAGVGVVLIPYLWVSFALWEGPSLLRTSNGGYGDNFYDLQAAILHGRLYLPNGSIGGEAFLHNGHQYMYFGLFPSLLRMPILLVTNSLDGRLTAISIFIAWLLTGLFSALLVWRVRILIRGSAILGRAEATTLGVFIATIMGGSVLVSLAANPYVYSEDFAWSVALTTGSFFALLGVLERPSSGRIVATAVLVLAAYNTRATTGLSCAIGALLVAAWFAVGREGAQNRRWWLPMLTIGLVPIMIGCAINYSKFGLLFGFKTSEQIAAQYFGGRERPPTVKDFSLGYLPTTIQGYLRPIGVQIDDVFPYITMPQEIRTNATVVIDPTASLPASMPLMFLLGIWGTVCALMPRLPGRMSAIRLMLIAAAVGGGALLLFGYVIERYLADFLPYLILAGAVGVVDVWRRIERNQRSTRTLVSAVIAILGLFSIAANFGIATSPTETWSSVQASNYIKFEKSMSDVTGHPLAAHVTLGFDHPRGGRLGVSCTLSGTAPSSTWQTGWVRRASGLEVSTPTTGYPLTRLRSALCA